MDLTRRCKRGPDEEGATVDLGREGATVDLREGATVDLREGATVYLRRRCNRGSLEEGATVDLRERMQPWT